MGHRFLTVVGNYERQNRLVKLPKERVDSLMHEIKRKHVHKDFDDPHLVAMVIISKCRVVCTNDDRAVPFLTDKRLYPRRFKLPHIFKNEGSASLCCNENIVPVCRGGQKPRRHRR